VGKSVGEVMTMLPAGVQLVAVRAEQRNQPASPEVILHEDAVVLVVGPSKELLEQTRKQFGEAATGQITGDRRDLDYLRVFVSRPSLVGRAIGDLTPPEGTQYTIAHVRRGDADLLGRPDLVLEFGDRVGLLTHRASFPTVRKFFGDSIKGTAEFSYISIGLGMALGFLAGAIHVPLPGIGKLVIGLAGVLVVALVLGKLRRTWGLNWTIPVSANLVLRNLGLRYSWRRSAWRPGRSSPPRWPRQDSSFLATASSS
jgi:putative transport protein